MNIGGGEVHALGAPHKQAHAEHLFQLHQPFAGSRHRDGFTGRRTGQRALLLHRDEQLQGDQIQSTHQALVQHQ